MYNIPELFNTRNYCIPIPDLQIDICKRENRFVDYGPCKDKDVYELCRILVQQNGYNNPETPNDSVELYVKLRREIMNELT